MDCQHTSYMRTHALEFLRLCILVGLRISDVKPFVSHEIFFGVLPHQARLWGIKKYTVLFPVITGPSGPSMPPGLPQAQPPLPHTFSQPQGGLYRTSYHLYASSIQQLIVHATSTQTKNYTGEEGKWKDGPEFKVLAAEKDRMKTMYVLDDEDVDAASHKWFRDLFEKNKMRRTGLTSSLVQFNGTSSMRMLRYRYILIS